MEPTLHQQFGALTKREFSKRRRYYHIIHGKPVFLSDRYIAYAVDAVIFITVAVSTALFIVETVPEVYDPRGPQGPFFALEATVVAVLTADIALRFSSAIDTKDIVNLQAFLDILSVIGFYASLATDSFGLVGTDLSAEVLRLLRLLRLARVVRLFRRTRLGQGFLVVAETFIRETGQGLVMLALVVLTVLIVAATLYFNIENWSNSWDPVVKKWYQPDGQESPFQTIPNCFWIVTLSLTTVGYGDVFPYSGQGRLFMVGVMFTGVLFLALPTMLVSATFETLHKTWGRYHARRRLAKTFRKVRYAIRFTRMWRGYKKSGTVRSLLLTATADDDKLTRRFVNFMFNDVDINDIDFSSSVAVLSLGQLDKYSVKGLTAVQFLQRTVEMFSGCCTSRELLESFSLIPQPGTGRLQLHDLCLFAFHLANAKLLRVYIINRTQDLVLITVPRHALRELQHHLMPSSFPCVRSLADAERMWKRTTGHVFDHLKDCDGFRHWETQQALVPSRERGFEFDHRQPAALANDVFRGNHVMCSSRNKCCACLHCTTLPSTLMRDDLNAYDAFLDAQDAFITQRLMELSALISDVEQR